MRDKLGGRRFLLSCACLIVATILQYLGKLDPAGSSYAMIIIGVVGVYVGGNVMERNSVHRYSTTRNNDALERT